MFICIRSKLNNYIKHIFIYSDEKKTFSFNTLSGKLLKKVLCHEITHAAMFSYNVDLSVEQEEIIADIISTYGEEIIYITNKVFNKLRKL